MGEKGLETGGGVPSSATAEGGGGGGGQLAPGDGGGGALIDTVVPPTDGNEVNPFEGGQGAMGAQMRDAWNKAHGRP